MAIPQNIEEYNATTEYYDKVYERKEHAEKIYRDLSGKINENDKRTSLLEQNLKLHNALLKIITASCVGTLITLIASLLTR